MFTLPSRSFVRGKGEPKSLEGTARGDPIAIGIYALGITPIMTVVTSFSESAHHSLSNPFYNVDFADDFPGRGKLKSLKQWFDEICRRGPFIRYYVNPTNTWVIVKDHELEKAFRIFTGTGIKTTSDGRIHLGGVTGTNEIY